MTNCDCIREGERNGHEKGGNCLSLCVDRVTYQQCYFLEVYSEVLTHAVLGRAFHRSTGFQSIGGLRAFIVQVGRVYKHANTLAFPRAKVQRSSAPNIQNVTIVALKYPPASD